MLRNYSSVNTIDCNEIKHKIYYLNGKNQRRTEGA